MPDIIHRRYTPQLTPEPCLDETAGLLRKQDGSIPFPNHDLTLRSSLPTDALYLVHNALMGQGRGASRAVTETLARLAFEECIKTVDDVRHISLPVWSDPRHGALTGAVHLALALHSIRVLVAAQALSLLPAAVSFFLKTPLLAIDKAFRLVIKQIAALPAGSQSRNQLLLSLLHTATRRRYRLDGWTHNALLFGKDVDSRLVQSIRRHMDATKAPCRDSTYPRMARALAMRGDKTGTVKLFQRARQSRRERTNIRGRDGFPLASRSPPNRPTHQGITVDNVMLRRSFTDHKELRDYELSLLGHWRSKATGPLHYLDARGWRTYLDQLGAIFPVTGKDGWELTTLLLKLETSAIPASVNVKMYTSVISSLIQKRAWLTAWKVWERLRLHCVTESEITAHTHHQNGERKWRLDRVALSLGVTLLCRRRHELAEAFAMVHALTSAEENTAGHGTRVAADTILINHLLEELRMMRRTDAVFLIWQEMSRQYGVHRDNNTLIILLRAAAYGSVGEEKEMMPGGVVEEFAGTMADGFQRLVLASRRRKRLAHSDTASKDVPFGHRVRTVLNAALAPRDDVLWDGMIAWQRARLVFLEVLLGNWPGLRKVQPPTHTTDPIPERARGATATPWVRPPLTQLLNRPPTSPYPSHIEFLSQSDPRTIPPVPSTPLYPEILLTDQTFRAYIQLLGEHSLQAQIPLALAWMRCLAIRPSKNTLATALAYFREVTKDLDPPLVGAYGKHAGKDAYARFTLWVQEWAKPHDLVLDSDAVSTAWRKARRKRESADTWDETIARQQQRG